MSFVVAEICSWPLKACNGGMRCVVWSCGKCANCINGTASDPTGDEEVYEGIEGIEATAQRPPLLLRMGRGVGDGETDTQLRVVHT